MRNRHLIASVLVVIALAGCVEGPTEGGWISVLGVIPPETLHDQALAVPGSARVGVPFSITVATIGSSNCIRPMSASLHVDQLAASVYPFDLRYVGAGANCLDDAVLHPRSATITFQEPGEATVTVVGIHPDVPDQKMVVERVIQVEP